MTTDQENKIIGFNKYQTFGKIIFIIILTPIFVFLFLHLTSLKVEVDTPIFLMILLPMIFTLLFGMYVLMILEVLFFAKGVSIDFDNNTLTLYFFLTRPIVISENEISNFATTKIVTKSTEYKGLLIHLLNGRKYMLGDFNLTEYTPIRTFMEQREIRFSGHEKISVIAYFISYFRKENLA